MHPMTAVLRKIWISCWIALSLATPGTVHAADVCRLSAISGMETNKHRAASILPRANTSNPSAAKVYVEFRDGTLYYQSNFISPGADYPTKVAGDPTKTQKFADPKFVFVNIVHDERPSAEVWAKTEKTMQDDVELFIDKSVFDEFGVPRIDLSGIKNFHVVDGNLGVSLSGKGEILTTATPPPSAIAKIKGCCLYGRPPHLATAYGEALSKRPFDASNVKVASLFIDRATEDAFQVSRGAKAARVAGDGSKLNDINQLKTIFATAKGKTLILIGHVEGVDYVVRNSANAEKFRVPIETIRSMARENNVSLIDIGCETTAAIQTKALGFGVIGKYNSVEAVKSVERALQQSRNLQDMLEAMSSEGLKIVIDQNFVKERVTSTRASVYSQAKNVARSFWVRVAQVTFTSNVQ